MLLDARRWLCATAPPVWLQFGTDSNVSLRPWFHLGRGSTWASVHSTLPHDKHVAGEHRSVCLARGRRVPFLQLVQSSPSISSIFDEKPHDCPDDPRRGGNPGSEIECR